MNHFTKCKVWVLASLLLFANSCEKEKESPVFYVSENPVALQSEDNFAHFTYNQEGALLSMGMYEKSGRAVSIYNFRYEGANLKSVVKGNTTWNYIYDAGKLVRIKIVNAAGSDIATYELSYNKNGKLAEQVNYFPSSTGKQVAGTRSMYFFNEAGNLSKIEHYSRAAAEWVPTGETRIDAYDQQRNNISQLENYPFIPGLSSSNNPLREECTNEFGEVVETLLYEYTYDAWGRVLSRKTTHLSAWFPETITYTNIHY